jgi:hypothetical protein
MGKRSSRLNYEIAVHEAGHAVVAHLVGIEIDHVTIEAPRGGGYSMSIRDPEAVVADKLWAEAVAISRKLVFTGYDKDGKHIYALRRRCRYVQRQYKGYMSFKEALRIPAPGEMVDRMERLRRRANAIWKRANKRRDHVKDLMHILGGPVADCVFFNEPFEAPRSRLFTNGKLKAYGIGKAYRYGSGDVVGNVGAGGDFRLMRQTLKYIDNDNWQEAREHYRNKVERLVRRHKRTIERVAKALLRQKTLTGAKLVKIIGRGRR